MQRVVYAPKRFQPTAYYRQVQDNQQDAVRLVGFVEYGKALQDFQRLLQTTPVDELQVMDSLLRDDAQYAVTVNLARRMPQAQRSAFLVGGDADVRRGLPWIIALARLEYGAILAGFSPESVPFPVPAGDALDGQAFDALLLESALMHAWALEIDPVTRSLATRPTTPRGSRAPPPLVQHQILAYERRLSLAWKILQAVEARMGTQMSPKQRSEFLELSEGVGLRRAFVRNNLLKLGTGIRNEVRRD